MSKDDKGFFVAMIFMSSGLFIGAADKVDCSLGFYIISFLVSMLGFKLMYKWFINDKKAEVSDTRDAK